ncbi:MAG TPA: PilZ domain-containing protein [Dongiaceae bacterium]|nr:PilZ domain-containing protein [Dongiaceae bacterium]
MPQASHRRVERREDVRADAQLSMRLGALGSAGPEIVTETRNISASGLYCLSPHYLAPLSKVDLTLVLPDGGRSAAGRLLQCEAVVVRCQAAPESRRRYELACSFLGLPETQRRLLAEYVALRNLKSLRGVTASTGTGTRKSTGAGRATTRGRAATGAATRRGRALTRPATRTSRKKSGGGRRG